MKPDPRAPPPGKNPPAPAAVNDESTGLPGLRTWRRVYHFVLGVFLLWLGLLAALTARYS